MTAIEERTLNVWQGKVKPRVRIAGQGPPLVFFHGAYGLAWDSFLDALAARFTVFAPEHPGTTPGDPDGIKPLDNLWDLVLYYYEVFDALGLEAPLVVGHSFGGMVAAEVAATDPRRVARLVLLAPIGLWRDDLPVKNWMVMPQEEVARAAFVDPGGPVARQLLALPDEPQARMDAEIHTTWALACTGKFIWPIPDKGLKKRVHRIKAPTLIVWGRRDGIVDPAYGQEFARRIAGARLEIVDGAAHVPHLERIEAVSEIVVGFLSQPQGAR